ncbi:MAG: Asp-tRNA(Asn)/Glu-tRNA(Gln) amidotransferase A subunit family amidase [Halioglobus sp.]|jgi:Asp-tRNA(Asn)/Glu-tRNA(Gln) amidotransferase A subunit family amidase
MARYVDDLALLLPTIIGAYWRDPTAVPMPLGNAQDVTLSGLRISFHTDNGIEKASNEVADTIRQAGAHLQDCCALVEAAVPGCIDQTEEI